MEGRQVGRISYHAEIDDSDQYYFCKHLIPDELPGTKQPCAHCGQPAGWAPIDANAKQTHLNINPYP